MGTVARMATRDDVTALAQLRHSWTTELGVAVEDPRFAATFVASSTLRVGFFVRAYS